MNKSAMIASFFTVLVVLGVVAYRLLLGSVIRCQRSGTRSFAQIAKKLAAPAF